MSSRLKVTCNTMLSLASKFFNNNVYSFRFLGVQSNSLIHYAVYTKLTIYVKMMRFMSVVLRMHHCSYIYMGSTLFTQSHEVTPTNVM